MVSTIEYFIGIIIVAILLLASIIKYRNNEKEWIIMAVFIGLASLPISLFFIGQNILYILILSFILSIFYAVIRKNPKAITKTFLVAFLVSVIVFVGWFNVSMSEGGLHVVIQKYDSIEEMSNRTHSGNNIVLLTEEDLNKHPGIKKAIDECVNSNNCNSKVDTSEWKRNNVSPYVKINGGYYLLTFYEPD